MEEFKQPAITTTAHLGDSVDRARRTVLTRRCTSLGFAASRAPASAAIVDGQASQASGHGRRPGVLRGLRLAGRDPRSWAPTGQELELRNLDGDDLSVLAGFEGIEILRIEPSRRMNLATRAALSGLALLLDLVSEVDLSPLDGREDLTVLWLLLPQRC